VGRIVTLASWKGGASKTTVATVLAVCLARRQYRVAVVDADSSRHFAAWYRIYEGPPITCSVESRPVVIAKHVRAQNKGHDVTIVDTAALNNPAAAECIRISDLVLIPMLPDRSSVVDAIRAAHQTQAIAQKASRQIPFRLLKSRWNPRGLVERWVLADIERQHLPVLEQNLSQLADFGKLTLTGVVPRRGTLSAQVNRIIDELVAIHGVPGGPGKSSVRIQTETD
jgi:cellulose biosynthesis protein BcsQ